MTADKVIYTDGRDVVVTDTTLKVKNASYLLSGITKLYFWTIKAERWPGIFAILIGLIAAISGYMGWVPQEMNMQTDDGLVSGNTIAIWAGLGLLLIGIIALAASKERYAVRIGTAEGEKNAVVSTKREYISQIVDAVHSAFDLNHPNSPIVVTKK